MTTASTATAGSSSAIPASPTKLFDAGIRPFTDEDRVCGQCAHVMMRLLARDGVSAHVRWDRQRQRYLVSGLFDQDEAVGAAIADVNTWASCQAAGPRITLDAVVEAAKAEIDRRVQEGGVAELFLCAVLAVQRLSPRLTAMQCNLLAEEAQPRLRAYAIDRGLKAHNNGLNCYLWG